MPPFTASESMFSYNNNNNNNPASSAVGWKSLTVQIVGHASRPDVQFDVEVSDLRQREDEMKRTAHQFHIPASRWKASRLYLEYQTMSKAAGNLIRLDPERDLVLQNYSCSMDWQPWLTRLLADYYRSGKLNIPGSCQGSDLLLALEYFGILYAPDQLVFASHAAYQRVRCWSDYLTHRTIVADWIAGRVRQFMSADGSSAALFFATALGPDESLRASGRPLDPWWPPGDDEMARRVFRLFNESRENAVADNLREDFCAYVQNLMLDVQAEFAVKTVEVRSPAGSLREKRAILKIVCHPRADLWQVPDEGPEDRMEEKKTEDVVVLRTQQSPNDVAHDIYQEDKPKGHVAWDSNLNTSYEIDRNDDGSDDFYKPHAAPVEQKGRTTSDFSRPRSIDPVFATSESGWNAPVDIIDPERLDGQTVTSGLTGPHFPSEASISSEDVRAAALRHEWVQGSFLNKDITKQMRQLLDIEEQSNEGDMEPYSDPLETSMNTRKTRNSRSRATPGEISPRDAHEILHDEPTVDPPTGGCNPWDWITGVCSAGTLDSPVRAGYNSTSPMIRTKSPQNENYASRNTVYSPMNVPVPPKADRYSPTPPIRVCSSGTSTGKSLVKDRLTLMEKYPFEETNRKTSGESSPSRHDRMAERTPSGSSPTWSKDYRSMDQPQTTLRQRQDQEQKAGASSSRHLSPSRIRNGRNSPSCRNVEGERPRPRAHKQDPPVQSPPRTRAARKVVVEATPPKKAGGLRGLFRRGKGKDS